MKFLSNFLYCLLNKDQSLNLICIFEPLTYYFLARCKGVFCPLTGLPIIPWLCLCFPSCWSCCFGGQQLNLSNPQTSTHSPRPSSSATFPFPLGNLPCVSLLCSQYTLILICFHFLQHSCYIFGSCHPFDSQHIHLALLFFMLISYHSNRREEFEVCDTLASALRRVLGQVINFLVFLFPDQLNGNSHALPAYFTCVCVCVFFRIK